MQKMFEDYKEIADFRLVYINEAHAADGDRPVGYAKELNITEHEDYGERCQVAQRLLTDKSLTIPTIIDGMDNEVSEAYKAHPDRIFVVGGDGKLAVAGARGPWGFVPALEQTGKWLADFKKTGKQPELPKKQDAPGRASRP